MEGSRSAVAATLALCVILVACGSRRSVEELAAAAGASLAGVETTPAAGADGGPIVAGPSPTGSPAGAPTGPGGGSDTGQSTGAATAPTGSGAVATPTPTGGSGGGGGGTPSPGPGTALAPIRIGSVGQLSGPAGATIRYLTEAVQVWAAWINDRGGVNGHPVEVLAVDDGGDPQTHRQAVQRLVEEEGVIAFVANPEALTGPESVSYMESVGVATVGSTQAHPYYFTSPVYRPQAPHERGLYEAVVRGIGAQARDLGLSRWAIVTCVEVQTCDYDQEFVRGLVAEYGGEVVYWARASLAQPDYTAECLNARSAGADLFYVSLDSNSNVRLASACARQGYRPTYGFGAVVLTDDVRSAPGLEGALIGSTFPNWADTSVPGVAEMHEAYAQYAPGVAIHPNTISGWVSAKIFEACTRSLPADPTPRDVLVGCAQLDEFDAGGLTAPYTYPLDQPASNVICWFQVRIQGGQWVSPNGNQRECRR